MALPCPAISHSPSSLIINPTQTPSSLSSLIPNSSSNITHLAPLHAHLITTNLIQNPHIISQVFSFLISQDNLDYAHQICCSTHEPEAIIWNTLLETELQEGFPHELFETYFCMVTKGVCFDLSTFHFLIHACSGISDAWRGREVHGRILKSGFGGNRSLNNNLMGMYSKCGELEEVRQVFDKMRHRNVVSWNTMISCYVSRRMYREALNLLNEMIVDGVMPDEITMVCLISACTKLRDLEIGKRLLLYIEDNNFHIGGSLLNCLVDMCVKCGDMAEANRLLSKCSKSEGDVVLWTTLISGYVKSNKIDEARRLFDQMTEKNLVSWTAMISGYARSGYYLDSLELFGQMRFENVNPDEVALVTALSACARVEDVELGRAIHGFLVKFGLIVDGFLGNALMDLYAKCEKLSEACIIFEQLPLKSVTSWNTMLDGICRSGDIDGARNFFVNIPIKDEISWNTMINFYFKSGMFTESFKLFHEMQSSNIKPDKLTLISLLSSCAKVGALNHGIWIHAYIKKYKIGLDSMLGTALLDMYGKCGCVEIAYQIFSEIVEKNAFVWTAMIAAYAMEGHAQKAVGLYLEMEEMGIKPDYVTFIALLSACSHGGLVDEGYKYFNKMTTCYNISPRIQHYGCMVDLLGRMGHLEEAKKFIEKMPMSPDVSIWSSLMRACGSHNNVELAEHAFEHITEIDPKNAGSYMLLSNIYANAGRWDDVSRTRTKLHDIGMKKKPGLSIIELNGIVHEFTAGDFSNPESIEIHSMLEEIERRLRREKLPNTSYQHSERLAVAFGLISSYGRSPIRVVNNVRMCGDCHSLIKLISEAYAREIVIRDNYRFHRFKDGYCSCNDYW